jgi:tetratricopeptide (TPR) repeat protein
MGVRGYATWVKGRQDDRLALWRASGSVLRHTEMQMVDSKRISGDLIFLLLAGGLVALAFAPALLSGFLLDDHPQLAYASQLTGWGWLGVDAFGMARPGKNLLFMWMQAAWPGSPTAWHVLGLILHMINVALVGVVSRRFGFRLRTAVVLALVWGLAPTHVSTVCWASCLNIQVATAWALVYLICTVGPSDTSLEGLWRVLGLAALFLALFFYEAVLPVVLLPWLWRVVRVGWRRGSDLRTVGTVLGGVLIVGLFLYWRHLIAPGLGGNVVNEQIVGETPGRLSIASGYLLLRHAMIWLWPFGRQGVLTMIDLSDQATLVAVFSSIFSLLAIGVLLAKGVGVRGYRRVVFGMLWFAGTLLPLCNLIPLGNGPIADYYLYFSSIGLTFSVVAWGELLWARRLTQEGVPGLTAQALLYGLIGWRAAAAVVVAVWAMYWKDEASLLERTIRNDSGAYAARAALAAQLVNAGKLQEAEVHAREALAGVPTLTQGCFALGSVLAQSGRAVEAAVIYSDLVREHPRNVAAHVMLGGAMGAAGKMERARDAYGDALALPWDARYSWQAARNLAGIHYGSGKPAAALAVLAKALVRAPNDGRLHQTAAVIALEMGLREAAREHALAAMRSGFPLDSAMHRRILQE